MATNPASADGGVMAAAIARAQRRIVSVRRVALAADGILGPLTMTSVLAWIAARPETQLGDLGKAMAKHLPAYGIIDNASRLSNFLGQACHETMDFRYLRELWGPTPTQRGFEGRHDLGNDHPGDGRRYLGRGIFQLTGRANYRAIGAALGLPLEDNPVLAEQPEIAVRTACEFWRQHRLSDLADAGQEDAITHAINGGTNGIAQRRALVLRARELFA